MKKKNKKHKVMIENCKIITFAFMSTGAVSEITASGLPRTKCTKVVLIRENDSTFGIFTQKQEDATEYRSEISVEELYEVFPTGRIQSKLLDAIKVIRLYEAVVAPGAKLSLYYNMQMGDDDKKVAVVIFAEEFDKSVLAKSTDAIKVRYHISKTNAHDCSGHEAIEFERYDDGVWYDADESYLHPPVVSIDDDMNPEDDNDEASSKTTGYTDRDMDVFIWKASSIAACFNPNLVNMSCDENQENFIGFGDPFVKK